MGVSGPVLSVPDLLGGWTSITLPQMLNSDTTIPLESFEDATDWSVGNGAAADNSSEFLEGTQSVKLTPTAGASLTALKTVAWDVSGAEQFRIAAYLHDETVVPTQLIIYFSSSAFVSGYFQGAFDVSDLDQGWNYLTIQRGDFSLSGSESWASTMNRFQIRLTGDTGEQPSMSFDKFAGGPIGDPVVLFTFDDARDSVYQHALPYMRPRGIPGTVYMWEAKIDAANYLTAANLIEMNALGWSIGNHSSTHPYFTSLTQAEIETELNSCKTALDALGLTDASDQVAFPFGAFDADTFAAMSATAMKTGRAGNYVKFRWVFGDVYKLNARYVANTDSLPTVKGWLDTAVSRGEPCIFMFHHLVAAAPGANEWAISDFQALIDYVIAQKVQCLNIKQLYDLISESITVRRTY